MADTQDLVIQQGKTFNLVLRWESSPIVRKAITAITAPNGAARITATAHGIPDGWRCAVTNVKGMTEINALDPNRVRDSEYTQATVIDANTVELNEVNAASFKPYVSGGFLQYNTPVSLTGHIGRMTIKDKVGGTVLASTEVIYAPLNILNIVVDAAARTITLTISALSTAAITWKKGVFDLEMLSPSAVVTALITGNVSVLKEVTT